MQEVEKQIQEVEKQIQEVEKKVKESGSDREIMLRFMTEKEQLRNKEERLRNKEERLRNKEELLRKEKEQLLLKEHQPQLPLSMYFNNSRRAIRKMEKFLTIVALLSSEQRGTMHIAVTGQPYGYVHVGR